MYKSPSMLKIIIACSKLEKLGPHQFKITILRCISSTMSDKSFEGRLDRYNGVTVDSMIEPCKSDIFTNRLEVSLKKWIEENRRTIWFRVNLIQAEWIPILTSKGFQFHHARDNNVTLYKWLPRDETPNIPPYAHTNLGVGAFVLNQERNEILVIKEKYSISQTPMWKLPGGYVEPGEDISDAAEREIFEETGVRAKFKCLIAFRHVHKMAFDCSDIYIVVCLTPETSEINRCNREISECMWMRVEEYVVHPQVHENNRMFAQKIIDFMKNRIGLGLTRSMHPILDKKLCFFSIDNIDS